MKICRVFLGAVFTFVAMECQASTKPYAAVDIFEDGVWGFINSTPASVKVDGFRTKNITDFDINKTTVLTPDQKKSFVKHLFTSDDQHAFFTYALLVMATRGDYDSGKVETQSRATTILRAIQANADMNNAFTSNPNRVIILNRRQDNLGVGLQRRSSFGGSPAKVPVAVTLRFSPDDISVIESRLGIVKSPVTTIVGDKSDEKLPSSVNAKRGSSSSTVHSDDDLDDLSKTPSIVVDPIDKDAVITSLIEQIKTDRLAATQAVQEAMTAQMSSTWSLIKSTGFSITEVKKGLGKDPITPEEALFGALVFASQAVDDKVNLEVELEELRSTRVIQETTIAFANVPSTAAIPSHDYNTEIAHLIQSPARVDQSNQDVLIPSLKDQITAIRLAREQVLGDISNGVQMSDAFTLITSAGFSQTEVKKGLAGKDPTNAEEALRGALTFANQEVDAKTNLEVELDELKTAILESSTSN